MIRSRVTKAAFFAVAFALLVLANVACSGSRSSPAVPSLSAQTGVGTSVAGAAVSLGSSRASRAAAAASSYSAVILQDNPSAYYQLSDSSTTLADSGPNGITGVYGSAVVRGATAITAGAAGAATFPGGVSYNSQGYAYTAKNAALQIAQPTLEAWFSLNAVNATSHDLPIVAYGSIGRGARYGLFIHGFGGGEPCLQFQMRNAGQPALIVQSRSRLIVGHTYHVVVSFVGANVAMYIDGAVDRVFSSAGSVDYAPYFTDGFQIGGADQVPAWAGASFPGTIAQVAVYAKSLTGIQVVNHYVAGQMIALAAETPSQSDTFVDSIGINTHFDDPGSGYAIQFTQARSLLVASGIRHLRTGVTYGNAAYLNEMKELAAAGVYASYVTRLSMTQAQIRQWPTLVGSSFEQYEAPNEQDDADNPNWLPGCIAFQKSLYGWVKSDPQIARYHVVGPSVVGSGDAELIGNQSAFLDNGNIHNYFGVFNPGTYGWGGIHPPFGIYGSIAFNMNIGRVISGTKPIEATETGYGTTAGNPLTLDYRTHLRYMTRLFFEQFNNGIARTYSYELIDHGGTGIFGNFGLVTTSLQPKPAYTGIQSIISRLKDPGSAFATTPLTYEITGSVDAVHHTLMQKRNGHYLLAIWLELPSWITLNAAGGDIILPSQTVTLTTLKRVSSGSIATMDENGNMSEAPLTWIGQSTLIAVTDKVSLLDLAP